MFRFFIGFSSDPDSVFTSVRDPYLDNPDLDDRYYPIALIKNIFEMLGIRFIFFTFVIFFQDTDKGEQNQCRFAP